MLIFKIALGLHFAFLIFVEAHSHLFIQYEGQVLMIMVSWALSSSAIQEKDAKLR